MQVKVVLAFRWVFTVSLLYAIWLLGVLSIPYLAFRPGIDFLVTKQFIYHLIWWRWSFYAHVFSSSFIILSGLFQFNRWMIKNKPGFHRLSGKIYLILLVLISGPAAIVMGYYANGGTAAQSSFLLLGILWESSAILAYWYAIKGNFNQHANWMLRNYALTLSAVTLRFYNYLFGFVDLPFSPKETYILLTWISWIPNLLVAELLIKTGFIARRMR